MSSGEQQHEVNRKKEKADRNEKGADHQKLIKRLILEGDVVSEWQTESDLPELGTCYKKLKGGCSMVSFYRRSSESPKSIEEEDPSVFLNTAEKRAVQSRQRALKQIRFVEKNIRVAKVAAREARILRRLVLYPCLAEECLCLPTDMWRIAKKNSIELCILYDAMPMDLFDFSQLYPGSFSLRNIGFLMKQIVSGASLLHTFFSIIHNDIKPENVLIDPATLQCRLADFGGSCELDCTDQDEMAVLTFMYASPERITQTRSLYDERSDSWSLGVLAAELAYGGELVPSLIPKTRWNCLLSQLVRFDGMAMLNEVLDEPEFMNQVAPLSSDCYERGRRAGLRVFLQSTLRIDPCFRLTATELLDKSLECSAFIDVDKPSLF